MKSLCSWQEKKILSLVDQCRGRIRLAIERKQIEVSEIALTYDAARLHEEIEKTIDDLRDVIKNHVNASTILDNLSFPTLETLLPDLAVAGVLWFTDAELLHRIDCTVIVLACLVLEYGWMSDDQFSSEARDFRRELGLLFETTQAQGCSLPKPVLERNHDFLSQQIDERSHQLFTMGSLFVPVSFLIYTYAVTSSDPLLQGVPLMFASLACYLFWFIMYLRTGKLNQLSYPLIHSIEFLTGLSTHTLLNEIRKKHRLLKLRQQVFFFALFMLVALWVVFLSRPDDSSIKYPSWINAASLTFACLSATLLTLIWWQPSWQWRDLAKMSIIADFWSLPPLLRVRADLLEYFVPWGIVILVITCGGWMLVLVLLRRIIVGGKRHNKIALVTANRREPTRPNLEGQEPSSRGTPSQTAAQDREKNEKEEASKS